ncbi:hypothetical protein FISHEDRAFT_75797 [Fistulina hepatica ATCC 64428]|uniref:Uncharacterized protein n=1 Tax=Fistulina hepatica ATCC 64428 TaxID=1128425 RepID=A0A0D7A8L7_9AGAR|nr:hypothetical protein FISHEDRAFT_75797 [Fistulina hepatica ATCC 64428]
MRKQYQAHKTIVHGYILGHRELRNLMLRLYPTLHQEQMPPMDAAGCFGAYGFWRQRMQSENKQLGLPILFPIDLTPEEKNTFNEVVERDGEEAITPRRYIMPSHASVMGPSGEPTDAACVETERDIANRDRFLALVAKGILSKEDLRWGHMHVNKLAHVWDQKFGPYVFGV